MQVPGESPTKHQISVPDSYFKKSVEDGYQDPRGRAMWREGLQNSLDAGATLVEYTIRDGWITWADNGRGMDLQRCLRVFLVMGGTDKGPNDTGGYGEAKTLLCFQHEEWSIRSCDYEILGAGGAYEIREGLPFLPGVTFRAKTDNYPEYALIRYLGRCSLPGITVKVNGVDYSSDQDLGKKVREVEDLGVLYARDQKPESTDGYLHILVNGLEQTTHWVGERGPSVWSLILTGDTKAKMTSNRDALRHPYTDKLYVLARGLTVNPLSSSDPKGDTNTLFPGSGWVATGVPCLNPSPTTGTPASPLSALALAAMGGMSGGNVAQDKSYDPDRPDILVISEGEPGKSQRPAGWSYKTRVIMGMWAQVVRQVILDNRLPVCGFGVGVVYKEKVWAAFTKLGGVPYFVLNPGVWTHTPDLTDGRKLLIQELKQRAIHEAAHLVEGPDHDETFVSAMGRIEARTWPSLSVYSEIGRREKRGKKS